MRSNRRRTSPQPANTPPKLLSGLTKETERFILESGEHRSVKATSVIYRTRDPASNLYLLVKGKAKYYRVSKEGREIVLDWVAAGDTFGVASLMAEPSHYIGTAQALEDCELLVWSHETILSLADRNEVLARNALQVVLYYASTYIDKLMVGLTDKAEDRLAHALIQLAKRFGDVRSNGVELAVKNEDLAGLANVSAFTASRQLKEWERQGLVHKSRGKVFINAPERLLAD
jgi:CRP/FNR family transcriptional regulator, nitrogen oxide reductase regulator